METPPGAGATTAAPGTKALVAHPAPGGRIPADALPAAVVIGVMTDAMSTADRIAAAAAGRNSLVGAWRAASRPKYKPGPPPAPVETEVNFHPLFAAWLRDRGLDNILERQPDEDGWVVYKFRVPISAVKPGLDWVAAYHGSWWYGAWLIISSGVLLESCDWELGHDCWRPGV